jgi:hypothetical protein
MKPLKGDQQLRSVPGVLCGAPGLNTKILSPKKKRPGCKHRSRSQGEEWEKCFRLTSSLIGRVKSRCFQSVSRFFLDGVLASLQLDRYQFARPIACFAVVHCYI